MDALFLQRSSVGTAQTGTRYDGSLLARARHRSSVGRADLGRRIGRSFSTLACGRWPLLRLLPAVALVCFVGCGRQTVKTPEPGKAAVTFKPQEMADALHAVIAADREVYARDVLQRLQADAKVIRVSENWREDKSLPLPHQILRLASQGVQQHGAEFHYVLRSLWAINPRNGPETPTEKAGLEFIAAHRDLNYYSEESLGGRRYFTAVYADRAIVAACATCHNQHANSPKKDFKTGDVMGGLIVRVPLEF